MITGDILIQRKNKKLSLASETEEVSIHIPKKILSEIVSSHTGYL